MLKTGFDKVLLGLSGGIDSALTAAIAARALGPEKVLAIAMPTRYSSEGSLADARALVENLGIDFEVIAIDEIFQAYLDGLAPVFDGLEADVTEENIQARIRCGVLMALSNKFGRLLLTTGNKSELAVGYATLYGDMAGGLAVISDVPKTLVYESPATSTANARPSLRPSSTSRRRPSCRPDQTDQDSLPPYDELDRVVEGYVERNLSVAEMIAEGIDREVVETVVGLIDRSEYKRRQAAPGIKITAKAFGIGRRYPIVADYRGLHPSNDVAAIFCNRSQERHNEFSSRAVRCLLRNGPCSIAMLCELGVFAVRSPSPGFIFLHCLIIFSMALLIFLSDLSGLSEKTSMAVPRQTSLFSRASQMSITRVPAV